MYCIQNISSFPGKRSYFNIVLLCTKQFWPNSSFQNSIGKVIIPLWSISYQVFKYTNDVYVFLRGCNIAFLAIVKNNIVEEIIYHQWYCHRHVSRALKAFCSQFYFSIRIIPTFTPEYKSLSISKTNIGVYQRNCFAMSQKYVPVKVILFQISKKMIWKHLPL